MLGADTIDMTSDKDIFSVLLPVGDNDSAVCSVEESVVGSAVDAAAGSAASKVGSSAAVCARLCASISAGVSILNCMAARRVEMERRHLNFYRCNRPH